MLLRQLEYLDALARLEHFGRAAAECHVSQPALSSAIAKLERELGVSLVLRGRQYDGLTEEGRALLVWARAAIASTDGLRQEAAELRGGLAGTLRLGLIPSASSRVGRVVSGFLDDHPGVQLRLFTVSTTEIIDRIGRLELDGGLMYVDDPVPAPLQSVPLYRERFMLLTSDPSWALEREAVTWAQAARLPLSLLAPTHQHRRLVERAFRQAGLSVTPRAEADSIVSLIELACAGGSSIVADTWIEGRSLPPGTHVHPLVAPAVKPTIGLVTSQGALIPPTVRALRESVRGWVPHA